jgi:pilus assembly protein CpaE
METQLIRILPACLTAPLPAGWTDLGPDYLVELMPEVEHPEAVSISVQTTEPDILLIDTDLPGMDPFAIAQQAIEQRDGLAVIFVSEDNSPDRLRRAMLAGAEEYLIKPLDAPTLRESITAIASHRTLRTVEASDEEVQGSGKEGLVVGVVSGKGGLGKTTLAVNLAALVAKAPGKTAGLVGLESGDGAILLNLMPKLGLLDLASAATQDDTVFNLEILKQFGTPHRSGLTFWAWQGHATQPALGMPEDFFERLFGVFRENFDVTFVDFPLLTPEEAEPVLPLLDVIIVVSSSSDLLALRSTRTFMDMVPQELRPRVRIVVNRADPSDMINREDFESTLSFKVAVELPNEPNITAQAINMGSPFVLTQPQSDIATILRQLAQVLFKLPAEDGGNQPRRKRFMLFG